MNNPANLDRDAVLDLWAQKRSAPEIVKALGLFNDRQVYNVIERGRYQGDPRTSTHPVGTQSNWTDDQVTLLRQLWGEGVACIAIAQRLGMTKNAVIGKARRLDLLQRRPKVPRIAGPRIRGASQAKPRLANPKGAINKMEMQLRPRLIAFSPPTNEPVRFADIARIGCRYVIGEPAGPNTLMCGARINRKSLCGYHAALCWTPAPPKRVRAA